MSSIPYTQLNPYLKEIRLLCLHPGEWDDTIPMSLEISSLPSPELPFFEAVSYTWGDPLRVIPIVYSQMTILVTKSVENVLRRFRFTKSTRLLWIDALCINQDDDSERANQVQLMNMIYSRASRVLIYLGEADHCSDRAMDAIAGRKTSAGAIQKHVLEFFDQRPWFKRVWVLQEVALATCALAISGSKCVPWANFPAWWAQNAASLQNRRPPSALAFNSVSNKSLLEHLHDTRASRATDPRDKVYAIVAMSTTEERFLLVPNYRKSVASVYVEVATAIVLHHRSLRILSATQPLYGQLCASFGLSNTYLEPYDAGGSTALTKFDNSNDLSCYGIALDIISETGNVCPLETSGGDSIARVLTEWNSLVHSVNGTRTETKSRHGQGVFFVGEQFFIIGPAQDTIWPTLCALPTPTLELAPDELAKREACPATMERLKFCLGRKLLMTANGLLGLAPPQALSGDLTVIFLGAPVPHVLRKYDDGHYRVIGECYVHGVMGGEALAGLHEEIVQKVPGHRVRPFHKEFCDLSLQWFELE